MRLDRTFLFREGHPVDVGGQISLSFNETRKEEALRRITASPTSSKSYHDPVIRRLKGERDTTAESDILHLHAKCLQIIVEHLQLPHKV